MLRKRGELTESDHKHLRALAGYVVAIRRSDLTATSSSERVTIR